MISVHWAQGCLSTFGEHGSDRNAQNAQTEPRAEKAWFFSRPEKHVFRRFLASAPEVSHHSVGDRRAVQGGAWAGREAQARCVRRVEVPTTNFREVCP